MAKHYIGEAGTDLILDTGVLIGTVAFKAIKYTKPGGTTGTWTADLYSSYSKLAGATGTYFVLYSVRQPDFDTAGTWKFQAHVGSSDGTWFGETVEEVIFDAFQ